MKKDHGILTLVVACVGVFSAVSVLPAAQDAPPPRKVGQEELIQRILKNDLTLEALRGELRLAKAEVAEVGAWRDPELRLGYSRSSDRAVPRSYTETLTESVDERTRRSDQASIVRGASGKEGRVDASGTENRNLSTSNQIKESSEQNQRESIQRTITRKITPTRNGERIEASTTEQRITSSRQTQRSTDNYREQQEQDGPLGSNTLNINGSLSGTETLDLRSSETVTREEISERQYSYDPYEGSDQYSVELRLYPRNPWETRQLSRASLARVSLAEQQIRAMERERAIEIRQTWMELVFIQKESGLFTDRVKLFKEDLEYQQELRAAGVAGPEVLGGPQAGLFDARLDHLDARQDMQAGLEELSLKAELAAHESIDLSNSPYLPEVVLQGLDQEALLETAVESSGDLGRLLAESKIVTSNLKAREATRIPWLSVVSASYDYEERYEHKYRDEYGVMAGFTLPVFSWFNRDLGAREKTEIENLRAQRRLLEKRIGIKLERSLGTLRRAGADRKRLQGEGQELRTHIDGQLQEMDAKDPAFQEARMRLRRALLDVQRLELRVERAYAKALLNFEAVLGVPLNIVFKP